MVFGNFVPCTDRQKSVTLIDNPQQLSPKFFLCIHGDREFRRSWCSALGSSFYGQKKKKKNSATPPDKYVYLSKEAVRWQEPQDCKSSVLHRSTGRMLRKGEKSRASSLISGLPGWGGCHVPGAWTGLGPTAKLGWLTQPGGVPLVDPFKG